MTGAALLPIAFLLAVVILPAIAVIAVVTTIAGRRHPTRPICRVCRTPLPFAAFAEDVPCPHCSGTFAEAGPPLPARTHPWILGPLVAIACVAASIGLIFLSLTVRTMSQLTAAMASQSAPVLIGAAAKANSSLEPTVIEVDRRLRAGAISASELREEFLRAVKVTSAGAPNEAPPGGLQSLLALAVREGASDDELLDTALRSAWQTPALDTSGLTQRPPRIGLARRGYERTEGSVARAIVLREVRVDGRPVPFAADVGGAVRKACLLQIGAVYLRPSVLLEQLEPGRHAVEVVVDVQLVEGVLARFSYASDASEVEAWPEPLARYSVTLDAVIDIPEESADGSPRG